MAYPTLYTFIALAFYAEIAFAQICKFQCPGDGEFPHPTVCTKFCHCSNGRPYEKDCPAGLLFDGNTLTCLRPNEAHCGSRTRRNHPKCKINCRSDNGLFPHPTDCWKFCHCSNGIPYEQPCSAGLYFNPNKQECDYPKNAGCVTRQNYPKCKINCPKDNGLFPHPTDCQKYCHCSNGIPYEQECQRGLHFNPNTQTCDYPQDAGCGTRQNYPKCKINCPQDNGLFPDPTDCSKFCHCSNGIPYEQECDAGLHFNPYKEECDYPHYPNGGNCVIRHNYPKCKINCPQVNGLFPHPTDCWKFCQCSNGIPYEQGCVAGLHFNANTKKCDYPKNAGCEKTAV